MGSTNSEGAMADKALRRHEILSALEHNVRAAGRRLTRADHALREVSPLDEPIDPSAELLDELFWEDDTELTRPMPRVARV